MIYLQRHTDRSYNKWSKPLIIILILGVLFLLFNKFGATNSISSKFFSPLFEVGDFIYKDILNIGSTLSPHNEDALKNREELLSEIEDLRSALTDSEVIRYENEELRMALSLRGISPLLSASVLASSPQLPFDTILLNKGEEQNIKMGDFVLTSSRVIIGNIVKTTKNTSTVALNSFADKVHYGFIERTSESLEIKGLGGGGMHARVPIDFDIELQDKILTGGLPVYFSAVVSSIEEDRMSGFKEVFLSLPSNIEKARVVFVKPTLND